MDVSLINLSELRTANDFGQALKRRIGGRSLNEQDRRFGQLRSFDTENNRPIERAATSRSTIGQVFSGERLPSQPQLRFFLRSAGDDPMGEAVIETELLQWEEAARRIGDGTTDDAGVAQQEEGLPEPMELDDSKDDGELDNSDEAEGPPTRMREVRDYIMERQRTEYAAETTDIFQELAHDPSRDVLLNVLRTATEGGLITTAGVRMPIWETELHYRYVLGDDPEVQVNIERDDQSVLSTTVCGRRAQRQRTSTGS